MGNLLAISPAGAQPAARFATGSVNQSVASLSTTLIEDSAVAVLPVQAKSTAASVAPELPQETAARLLLESSEGIVLDNIPFTNDGAILLDDLPLPEKPFPEAKSPPEPDPKPGAAEPDLSQRAARIYLADREAVAPSDPAPDPQTEPELAQQAPIPAAPEASLSSRD
jgi:hypothetical protein